MKDHWTWHDPGESPGYIAGFEKVGEASCPAWVVDGCVTYPCSRGAGHPGRHAYVYPFGSVAAAWPGTHTPTPADAD